MSATSLVFSSKLSLPSMVLSTTNSHVLSLVRHVESVNNFHVNHHNHSISHPSWRKFQMMWYILTLCQRPPMSMSMFSLPTTVPSTTNPNVHYVASHVKNVNNSHLNHHHHSISSLNWRKFLPKWYILLSATSLVISSRLFLPSTVRLTTISHILGVVRHVERIKKLLSQPPSPQHITSLLKKISTEVIHPHVSVLPGLLLLVVLAVHSAADHQNHLSKN